VVAVGLPHHVTQRGNARQDVFVSDQLRAIYLELLREHASLNQLRVLAYCLMTNHLRLVVIPEAAKSMENAFRHAHSRFAQYWNTDFHTDGHLWQNRYYSCPVEEIAVGRVVSYVENNPVRARMAERAEQFAWSSARAHLGEGCCPRRQEDDSAGDLHRTSIRIGRVRRGARKEVESKTCCTSGRQAEESREYGRSISARALEHRLRWKRLVRPWFVLVLVCLLVCPPVLVCPWFFSGF
jgi:REP element-mobilizing transposase RayT